MLVVVVAIYEMYHYFVLWRQSTLELQSGMNLDETSKKNLSSRESDGIKTIYNFGCFSTRTVLLWNDVGSCFQKIFAGAVLQLYGE